MNPLRRVANWIDFFVSLVAAVYIFAVIWTMSAGVQDFWRQVATFEERWAPSVWAGLIIALLLIVGAILRAVQHVTRGVSGRYLVFDTPNGHVSVRAGSVEDVLNRTVRAMDEVADAQVSLELPKGATVPAAVSLRCRLYNRPNLLAVQDQVRAVLRQSYVELFPSEEPLPVKISVERILFQAPPPRTTPSPAPDADEEDTGDAEPIRPQYPVDEDK
ncbi:MAG: hypothetical protein ACODAJ_08440 [Planctomycetota bacterium]